MTSTFKYNSAVVYSMFVDSHVYKYQIKTKKSGCTGRPFLNKTAVHQPSSTGISTKAPFSSRNRVSPPNNSTCFNL